MLYNFNTKTLNGSIDLAMNEWKIIELLIKMDREPIKATEMADIIKCGTSKRSIRVSICRINKKTNGLIKNRVKVGYYIDEEIKLYSGLVIKKTVFMFLSKKAKNIFCPLLSAH